MLVCKDCSAQLADGSVFCHRCGARQDGTGSRSSSGQRAFWPERFGPAIVDGELGKGGMAVVFRARHEQLSLPVAVKAMSTSSPPNDIKRFKREARVGMRLSHKGCVKVYDFGEVEPFYYMIQEFVEGEDLRERIRRRTYFPWHEALLLSLDIARIMSYIHSCGVIHRDIKPANIFLPWRGGVKVGDFGLATEGGDLRDYEIVDEKLTLAGLAIGSPAYMPPEQFKDTSSVDERGDLYALGITMFELLTGEPPFRSKHVSALRDMHLNETRPRPSDRVAGIPPEYEAVILRLIERDPLDRFQSSEELVKRLEGLKQELDVEEKHEQEQRAARRTTRSYKTVAIANGIDLQEVEESPPDGAALPPGYRLLHPVKEGVSWKCLLVHHVESGQDLNLWLLDKTQVGHDVCESIKSDLLRIGAANVRGFNGAIAVGDVDNMIFAASFRNEGVSFQDYVEEQGTIAEEKAVAMIQDLNQALRPLHEAGISLRGIRPDRLYLDSTTGKTTVDVVATIICDEGLVSLSSIVEPTDLAYTAPERLNQAIPAGSPTADIFSIGSVLYRLMTGATIHRGVDVDGMVDCLRNKRPMSLRESLGGRCSRAVSDAVRRCLSIKAQTRFPSIEVLAQALKGRRRPTPSGKFKPAPPAKLSSFIGLDLGAASCCMASVEKDGRAQVILGPEGSGHFPCAVHIGPRQTPVVAEAALKAARKDPAGLFRNFADDLLNIERKEHPVILTALVARQMARVAEASLAERPREVVLAVPTMLGERERYSLRLAAQLGGFEVLGTIPDTTAAALAFSLMPKSKPTRALVLDLGSGCLSVAIIEIRAGNLQVLAADGLRQFGGNQWSERLKSYIADDARQRSGLDPLANPVADLFLGEQIETAKRILSTRTKARILVPQGPKFEAFILQRSKMEQLTRDLLQRLASVLENVLEKSNLSWNSVDRVLAIGGSARMPAVTKLLWKVTGRIPDSALDYMNCVAEGAAYYGLKLKSQAGATFAGKPARLARKIVVRNVATFSLGVVIDTPRGQTLSHTIIPEQSPLPAKVTKIFALAPDKKRRIRIRLVEGDPRAGAMRTIGVCTIFDVDNITEIARVATTYSLSEDGRLQVEAHETRTGKAYKTKIDRLIPGLDKIQRGLPYRRSSKSHPRNKINNRKKRP